MNIKDFKWTREPDDYTLTDDKIEIITQLMAQGVDGLAVIAADFDALEPVLTQAMGQGIAVVTFDSAANPDSRQLHVEQASIDLVGRDQMKSALEIIGGPGAEGTVGILSAQPESQLHADWCNAMLKEETILRTLPMLRCCPLPTAMICRTSLPLKRRPCSRIILTLMSSLVPPLLAFCLPRRSFRIWVRNVRLPV